MRISKTLNDHIRTQFAAKGQKAAEKYNKNRLAAIEARRKAVRDSKEFKEFEKAAKALQKSLKGTAFLLGERSQYNYQEQKHVMLKAPLNFLDENIRMDAALMDEIDELAAEHNAASDKLAEEEMHLRIAIELGKNIDDVKRIFHEYGLKF